MTLTQLGTNTITATATDNAGNKKTVFASVTVEQQTVDTTPPSISITSPAPGATVTAGTITVSGTASDTESGVSTVQVKTPSGGTITATAGSPGDYSTWLFSMILTQLRTNLFVSTTIYN